MLCFTADREKVYNGITFGGDSMDFHDKSLFLSPELKADKSSVLSSGFLRSLIGKTHTVLKCSMNLDEKFGLAKLLPPGENAESHALVLIYLNQVSLGFDYRNFNLKGNHQTIFTRFCSNFTGSKSGDYWYLIMLSYGQQVTYVEKHERTRQLTPVFTLHFDGEILRQTHHSSPQAFESATLIS